MWDNMFLLEISTLEKILRPILVYAFLMIGLRLAGKRELAQLNSMDLIVLLTISNTVQNAIIGPDNSVSGGLIGAATLLLVNHLVVRYLYSHPGVDRFVEGEASPLIEHGKLNHNRLKKELITEEELTAAAHKQGFASLDLVDRAVLEADGGISFVGTSPSPADVRYNEMVNQLKHISHQLTEVERAVGKR